MSDIEAERLDDIVIFPITRRHVAHPDKEGYSISEYCSLDCDSTLAPECDPSKQSAPGNHHGRTASVDRTNSCTSSSAERMSSMVEAIRQRVHDAVTIRFFVQRNNLVRRDRLRDEYFRCQHPTRCCSRSVYIDVPSAYSVRNRRTGFSAWCDNLAVYRHIQKRRLVALLLTLLIRDTARCFCRQTGQDVWHSPQPSRPSASISFTWSVK